MQRIKKIIKWSLITIVSLVALIIAFGIWFMSLIPAPDNLEAIRQTSPKDISYLTTDSIPVRGRVLAVVTSHDTMGSSGKETGYELTELARPYYIFQANGYEVDIASPQGGTPPAVIDDEDMGEFDYAFLNDPVAQQKVRNSIPLSQIAEGEYDAIYFAGGKGALFDFPDNTAIQRLITRHYESGRVIGAVCHGPAALVNVKLSDGKPLLRDKEVCGFTNEEELFIIKDARTIFPFLLQDKIEEQGGIFHEGEMYLNNIVVDGNLVTGQNPWSTIEMTEAMIRQMGHHPKPRVKSGQENAVSVLKAYEIDGYQAAKEEMIENLSEIDHQLIAMHSIVAAMQWRMIKSVDLIRLLANS